LLEKAVINKLPNTRFKLLPRAAAGSRSQRLAFEFEQGLDVGGILYTLVAVVGAAVGGDFG
jgi:hypothetical protein